MYYIITYDITDDKRRRLLSGLLDKYGKRVNYSVYECEFNKTKLKNLIQQIQSQKCINPKEDSLRFYHIHQNSISKSFEMCKKPEPFEVEDMFF